MAVCGLPTVNGPCTCAVGERKAANADGNMQLACDHHADQFFKPSRCPTAWKNKGYRDLDKADQQAFWIEKAARSELPPEKGKGRASAEQRDTTEPGAPRHASRVGGVGGVYTSGVGERGVV